jgi:tripartite-type tricarboxylate transporter receptor subunit TctC
MTQRSSTEPHPRTGHRPADQPWLDRREFTAALLSLLAAPAAQAQGARHVKLVYPFAAGGSGDVLSRIVADRLGPALGTTVIVENRTGASGRIGVKAVIGAEPDGATLLVTASPTIALYPHVYVPLDYDPFQDLAPVALLATFDLALAVSPQTPVKTLNELVDWVKANPAQASYGSPGAGGLGHFVAVKFTTSAGLAMRHVGYRGSGAAINDLIGGHIPVLVTPTTDAAEHHKSGRVRILATSGANRSGLLPDVPTFKELGVPVEGLGWFAAYAPAKTPADIVGRLSQAMNAALASPEVKDRLEKLGLTPQRSTPAELAAFQKLESESWAPAIVASGFRADQ